MSDSRYKMFRNFMVNELGISRDDIMQWTKEAIRAEVQKIVGQINVAEVIKSATTHELKRMQWFDSAIKDQIAKEIMRVLKIEISRK